MTNHSQLKSVCLGLAVAGLLAGCAQSGAPAMGAGGGMVADARSAPAGGSRAVEILRLPYGVPRVVAADHEGLGFGAGYAAAEDNACLLMDRAMTGRGERAAFLGAGEDEANVASDAYHRRIRQSGAVEVLLSGDPAAVDTSGEDARAFVRGYAAGVNRVLADGGVRDPACAGKAWVRNLTDEDIWYAALTPPFGQPIDAVTSARPPAPGGATTSAARVEDMLADRQGMGSNAYGFGSDATRDGVDAVLLGNPHYPWDGALRFYRIGLTIPGELNVVGAGLVTSPFVGIGHTKNIAWTHTVSTARRFGYYELTLDPEDPTRYIVDGESRAMTPTQISVDVRGQDGSIASVTRTIWDTEFGPVAVTEQLPWTEKTAFAFAAPSTGVRSYDQYLSIYGAEDVRELYGALSRFQATSFNTMAVDRKGGAFYGDAGLVPNVDEALVARCATSDTARAFWVNSRIAVLNAADPGCRWQDGENATAPGVFGPGEAPHLFRSDFVAQSNDSPWLTNPARPLTGYSPAWGDERTPRSLRTRLALDQVAQRMAGSDGLGAPGFDLGTVQAVMYSNRHYGGELLRDDVAATCRGSGEAALQPLCDALAGWDLKVNLDSRGAHTMALFLLAGGAVFEDEFDPENGAASPARLSRSDPAVLAALKSAAEQLAALGIAADAPLGEVVAEMRGDERIPIHGGPAGTGVFNMIIPEEPVPGQGWTSIRHGSSWIMTVEFSDAGVHSEGVLTYSQSTDPTSPHYDDQTRLFSGKGWEKLYLDLDEARAAAVSVKTLVW